LAPDSGVTGIIRTNILVVTVQAHASASTVGTHIVSGASIVIVATHPVVSVDTSGDSVASIICARVLVIAVQLLSANTDSAFTVVANGAKLGVIAWHRVGSVDTTLSRSAAIISTEIVIVAINQGTRQADATAALITLGAGIVVRALSVIGRQERAACFRVAGISGTRVVVVTRQ